MTDKLTLKIEREVKPKEISGLIFGTGVHTYPWWVSLSIVPERETIEDAQATDIFVIVVDDPEEPEGSGKTRRVERTMQQIADAAARAILKGYVYEQDAIKDDLGYCDAEQADCILQLAVLGGEETVYG